MLDYSGKVENHKLKKIALLGFIRAYVKFYNVDELETDVDNMLNEAHGNVALAMAAADCVIKNPISKGCIVLISYCVRSICTYSNPIEF